MIPDNVVARYINGDIKYSVHYKGSALHGTYETWYENGNRESSRTYVDGEIDGMSRWWYESGLIETVSNYSHGMCHGICTDYKEDGKISAKYICKDDRYHGEYIEYSTSTGKVLLHVYYVDDDIIVNLAEKQLDDVEKFELLMLHGAAWL